VGIGKTKRHVPFEHLKEEHEERTMNDMVVDKLVSALNETLIKKL
jgi:predicted small metal-binding protein